MEGQSSTPHFWACFSPQPSPSLCLFLGAFKASSEVKRETEAGHRADLGSFSFWAQEPRDHGLP